MILAVINATFAVAKRKSEKKDRGFESPSYCLPDGEEMSLAHGCCEATEIAG